MKKIKLLLIALLLIPLSGKALEKEETVYSNLKSNGEVNSVIVTNHIVSSKKETIEDQTELEDILNLNGKEKYELDENKLMWKSNGFDIFYRGTTKKVLPIETKITYYLDGKKIDEKDIIGKSGSVKIEVEFINNLSTLTKVNGTFKTLYTPFVVTLSTILDSDNTNISITNGKVVNTGTRNMVVGLSTPGMYESLGLDEFKNLNKIELTFDTLGFNLSNFYIVATPKLLDNSDLEIFNKLEKVYGSVKSLKDNMDLIDKSTKELEEGIATLTDGSSKIKESLQTVVDSLKLIEEGSVELNDGVNEAIDRLTIASATLNSNDLSDSIIGLNTLKQKNTAAIQNLENSNARIKPIYDQYDLSNVDESNITDQTILSVKKTYEGNLLLIELFNANNIAIDKTLYNLNDINTKVTTMLNEFSTGLQTLSAGTNALSSNLTALREGVEVLNEKVNEFDSGMSKLNEGALKLSEGITEFNNKGISTLYNYSIRINNYSSILDALINLSKNYNGYATNNANRTLFISIVKL